MANVRVLLLSRYGPLGASSRVRSLQYLPYLAQQGIDVDVAPLFDDDYVERLYDGRRPRWGSVAASYGARLMRLLRGSQHDIVWVEKELFPWLPAFADLILARRAPRLVLDYDDAVFHRYDRHRRAWVRRIFGGKIDAVMRAADLVLVGNDYLGSRARDAGARRIEQLPTVVDTTCYVPAESTPGDTFTVGWIGTPRTAAYLEPITPALAEVDARFILIGAGPNALAGLPRVERPPWSESTEVRDLQRVDVGMMPLPDEPFERGKCGYKLVQYMACGKPVVASPVGVNTELVEPGLNGYLSRTPEEWRDALTTLAADGELRKRLGTNGRRRVEAEYSLAAMQQRLAEMFRELVSEQARSDPSRRAQLT